jgi:hypothetical protein
VFIQLGGKSVSDPRFPNDSGIEYPGRLELHLYRPEDPANPQKIIIDEQGLTLDIQGGIVMKSTKDIIVSAGANLLHDGERIHNYGAFDDTPTARSISGTETYVNRNGRKT